MKVPILLNWKFDNNSILNVTGTICLKYYDSSISISYIMTIYDIDLKNKHIIVRNCLDLNSIYQKTKIINLFQWNVFPKDFNLENIVETSEFVKFAIPRNECSDYEIRKSEETYENFLKNKKEAIIMKVLNT